MKKYLNWENCFPLIVLYIGCPVAFLIEDFYEVNMVTRNLYEVSCVLSVWWTMLFYEGNFKKCLKWLFRYYIAIVPSFLFFYFLVLLGKIDFLGLINLVGISVASNAVMSVLAFGIRKKTENVMLVFIVVLLLFLCVNPSKDSLFGMAFWGWL